MSDLAAFLLARIAEDEAAAQAAQALHERHDGDRGMTVTWAWSMQQHLGDGYVATGVDGAPNPTRVLAECEAKRHIVEAEPERWVPQPDAPGSTVDMGCPEGMVRVYGKLITEMEFRDRYMELAPPSQTLLYLAQVYADHPDFREEWRA